MIDIDIIINTHVLQNHNSACFCSKELLPVHSFLRSIPRFTPTPLVKLSHLGNSLGLAELWVKDESQRLGLKAFKAMGAVYAVAKVLAQYLEISDATLSFSLLKEHAQGVTPLTFVTATDGNHGKAVAWAARELGQRAVVYLPKGASHHRVAAIAELGAMAEVTDLNYDDAVRLAAASAAQNDWHLVQDTAWQGYTDIPTWIMQGYTAIAAECLESLSMPPTHVFLQAGVGSFAGAMLAYFSGALGSSAPQSIIVEPHNAACIFMSAHVGDGKAHSVVGSLDTIMAGLSCGEPNPIAWDIIKNSAHAYSSCADVVTEEGMRLLAHPCGNDQQIVAGESGAVGMGLLARLMQDKNLAGYKNILNLGADSRVLLINTEGDTDPENYRRIVQ